MVGKQRAARGFLIPNLIFHSLPCNWAVGLCDSWYWLIRGRLASLLPVSLLNKCYGKKKKKKRAPSEHVWAAKTCHGCQEEVSCNLIFLLFMFKISIGLHTKQIITRLEGTAADKPKQDRATFNQALKCLNENVIRCWAVIKELAGCLIVSIRPWPNMFCL